MTSNAAALPAPATSIETPSERVLRVRAATFPRRLLAVAIDFLLVSVVALGVTFVAALILDERLPTAEELGPDLLMAGVLDRNPMALGAVGLLFGLGALYQIYLAGVIGQTIGLRLTGLRIISNRGTLPGPGRGIVRFLALCLSIVPAGLGWLWCLFDRERRAVHDRLAGTFVIFDP